MKGKCDLHKSANQVVLIRNVKGLEFCMSDVVVHVAVGDSQAESRFSAAVDAFAQSRPEPLAVSDGTTPGILVKTVQAGETIRKAVIFQDRQSATDFLAFWRRERQQA